MIVNVAGEQLEFLPERALHWPAQKILILSDVHLGKAESLQKEGIAMPADSGESDLLRLAQLVANIGPRHVWILGDFIHHRHSWTAGLQSELGQFFFELAHVHWHLILGNHERGSLDPLKKLPIEIHENDFRAPPFVLSHGHKTSEADLFSIEGHVHPVRRLRSGPLTMRLPCFVLKNRRLLLPSFGTWTGGFEMERSRGARFFAVTTNDVFEMDERASHPSKAGEE